jgi:hypothetical protein
MKNVQKWIENFDEEPLPSAIYSIFLTDKQGNQFIDKLIKD